MWLSSFLFASLFDQDFCAEFFNDLLARCSQTNAPDDGQRRVRAAGGGGLEVGDQPQARTAGRKHHQHAGKAIRRLNDAPACGQQVRQAVARVVTKGVRNGAVNVVRLGQCINGVDRQTNDWLDESARPLVVRQPMPAWRIFQTTARYYLIHFLAGLKNDDLQMAFLAQLLQNFCWKIFPVH